MPSRLAPIRAWLGHRRFPLYAALAAVVLTLRQVILEWETVPPPERRE